MTRWLTHPLPQVVLTSSKQSFRDDRKDSGVLLVDKEMISLQHTYATATRSLLAPAFEFRLIGSFVSRSTQRCDRTRQRIAADVSVCVTDREVSTQHRD